MASNNKRVDLEITSGEKADRPRSLLLTPH